MPTGLEGAVRRLRSVRQRLGKLVKRGDKQASGNDWKWLRAVRTGRLPHAISRGEFANREVLAVALFGFGNRIKKLLFAMQVAEALGAKFVFYWPHNAVDGVYPAEQVFDPDFLRAHQLTELPDGLDVTNSGTGGIRTRDMKGLEFERDSGRGRARALTILQGIDLPLASLADTFRHIRFHPRLETVRDYVDRELPRYALAIHIRRGDSFERENRIGGKFIRKHVPLPIIRHALQSPPEGGPVLLVGNAPELIESLATEPWIHSLTSFQYPGEVAPDRTDFFDFLALTKCDTILGGTSHFAVFPSLIAGSTLLTPTEFVPPEDMKACLLDYIRAPQQDDNPLEVALTCEFALRFINPSPKEREFLLENAFRADPANPVYSLRPAVDRLRKGDTSGAAALLEAGAEHGALHTAADLAHKSLSGNPDSNFSSLTCDDGFFIQRDWQVLQAYGGMLPWIDYYLGLRALSHGDRPGAAALFDRAKSLLQETPTWFDSAEFARNASHAAKKVSRWT